MKKLIMVPGPTNVHEETLRAMQKPIINHRSEDFHKLYSKIQENIKYVFQTNNDVFILSASGTGGVEFAVSNFIDINDNVLIPVFGEFSGRLYKSIAKISNNVIKIEYEFGQGPTYEDVKKLFDIHKNISVVAIVANETSTGVTVWDLEKILKIAKDRGAITIVDSVSILGGVNLPTDKWGIDVHVTASQKCLACPPGLALVSVSREGVEKYEKNKHVKTSYFDLKSYIDFHSKFETPYTPAIPLFYALDTSLEMIREEGLFNVFARHEKSSEVFYRRALEMNFEIFPKEEFKSRTVISLKTPSQIAASQLISKLSKEYNIEIAAGFGKLRESMIRIGCMGIINEEIAKYTMDCIKRALLSFKQND